MSGAGTAPHEAARMRLRDKQSEWHALLSVERNTVELDAKLAQFAHKIDTLENGADGTLRLGLAGSR